MLYTNCWKSDKMWINHVIKTDHWRSAPQIRPAPRFVVSRAYFNVLLICLQKYTNKGEQSRSARGTSGGAYLPDRHAASSCMTTNNGGMGGQYVACCVRLLPSFRRHQIMLLSDRGLAYSFYTAACRPGVGTRVNVRLSPKLYLSRQHVTPFVRYELVCSECIRASIKFPLSSVENKQSAPVT